MHTHKCTSAQIHAQAHVCICKITHSHAHVPPRCSPGDVSMWQGLVTGLLMIATPAMFDKMGWAGVASATPSILLWGGVMFFATCIGYQFGFASHAAEVAAAVMTGAAVRTCTCRRGTGARLHLLAYLWCQG